MRTLLLASLLFALSLNAQTNTYSENYRVTELNKTIPSNFNLFMHGDFEQIIRYDMIKIEASDEDNSTSEIVETVVNKIKELKKSGKSVKVSIVSHTRSVTDNANEKAIESDSYGTAIYDFFFEDAYSTEEAASDSKEYAKDIQEEFEDAGIEQQILYLEFRGALDQAYTDETTQGRDLSNGVSLTLYVYEPVDIDSDRDGVFDRVDACPNSPRGNVVDERGCSVDSDGDGILDYKDKCPKTPTGVAVTPKGCPVDLDEDGILDYKDKCLETPEGLNVDPNGCPLKSTLQLHFKPSSDKILGDSHEAIKKFAKFMNDNPAYKAQIIGHTDSIGKSVSNMALSKKRASSVRAALILEGVNAKHLVATGRGELDPIASNRTKEGRQSNRRIEVQLSY